MTEKCAAAAESDAIDSRDYGTKSIETTQLISGQVLGDGAYTNSSCRHKSDASVTTSGAGPASNN